MTKELLTELLATDLELLSIYHIEAPNTAEICANRTFKDLQNAKVEVKLIKENEEVIGYYGIEKNGWINNLTGFFLKPKYRTKKHIINFWNEVDKNFDKDYFVGVYSKNIPAINFLKKKSTTIYEHNNVVVFKVGR